MDRSELMGGSTLERVKGVMLLRRVRLPEGRGAEGTAAEGVPNSRAVAKRLSARADRVAPRGVRLVRTSRSAGAMHFAK